MQQYQQMDLQALIDLLANETQEYTKAFTRGAQNEVALRKTIIDALISEIKARKKENIVPHNIISAIREPQNSDTDQVTDQT